MFMADPAINDLLWALVEQVFQPARSRFRLSADLVRDSNPSLPESIWCSTSELT